MGREEEEEEAVKGGAGGEVVVVVPGAVIEERPKGEAKEEVEEVGGAMVVVAVPTAVLKEEGGEAGGGGQGPLSQEGGLRDAPRTEAGDLMRVGRMALEGDEADVEGAAGAFERAGECLEEEAAAVSGEGRGGGAEAGLRCRSAEAFLAAARARARARAAGGPGRVRAGVGRALAQLDAAQGLEAADASRVRFNRGLALALLAELAEGKERESNPVQVMAYLGQAAEEFEAAEARATASARPRAALNLGEARLRLARAVLAGSVRAGAVPDAESRRLEAKAAELATGARDALTRASRGSEQGGAVQKNAERSLATCALLLASLPEQRPSMPEDAPATGGRPPPVAPEYRSERVGGRAPVSPRGSDSPSGEVEYLGPDEDELPKRSPPPRGGNAYWAGADPPRRVRPPPPPPPRRRRSPSDRDVAGDFYGGAFGAGGSGYRSRRSLPDPGDVLRGAVDFFGGWVDEVEAELRNAELEELGWGYTAEDVRRRERNGYGMPPAGTPAGTRAREVDYGWERWSDDEWEDRDDGEWDDDERPQWVNGSEWIATYAPGGQAPGPRRRGLGALFRELAGDAPWDYDERRDGRAAQVLDSWPATPRTAQRPAPRDPRRTPQRRPKTTPRRPMRAVDVSTSDWL